MSRKRRCLLEIADRAQIEAHFSIALCSRKNKEGKLVSKEDFSHI